MGKITGILPFYNLFTAKIIGEWSLFMGNFFGNIMQPLDTCVEQIAYIQAF
jgi:hypothetical protein